MSLIRFLPIAAPLFAAIAVPLLVASLTWFLNEKSKRRWEEYQRKEESYKELVRCLRGWYIGTMDVEKMRGDFLQQLSQCWLYAPDEVIKKGYDFLDTVHTNQIQPESAQQKAMGDLVASIRNDLLSRKLIQRTKLTGSDYRHLMVIRQNN